MADIATILSNPAPKTLNEALDEWPEQVYTRSPHDWRDEIFYFLLPDRFSDESEKKDNLLKWDLSTPAGLAEIKKVRNEKNMKWDAWQKSGAEHFQGGTIKGIESKLGYLAELGVTTIWVGPIFRQRVEENTYHGYGIQNFLEIDPRFGTRKDLVDLVRAAHSMPRRMNVILDIIFNHSGCNWLYDIPGDARFKPPYLCNDSYQNVLCRNGYGDPILSPSQPLGNDDHVWPEELQQFSSYLRCGCGSLGAGDLNDDYAEHKRTDFECLRKFNLFSDETLQALALSYQYWIALADVDGFRIDTFKHVTQAQARTFCNAIKEYAETIGKDNFFLVAEIAGGDEAEDRYLDITGRNLDACLDIGQQREIICNVSKGLAPASVFFAGFDYYGGMGSHRNWGSRHLSISNDHDHVFGPKVRLAADASNDHQAVAAVALQLFTLGIPCLYYGMEQGLAGGAEKDQQGYLKNWGGHDCLLREAMFGPEHPRAAGWQGAQGNRAEDVPGFGPHGTSGKHVFNPQHPIYTRIAQLTAVQHDYIPLRRGRQYQRDVAVWEFNFGPPAAGQIIAWSRIFDDQEVLVIVNPHGTDRRGGRVTIDKRLSRDGMTIVANTDPSAPNQFKPMGQVDVASNGGRDFVEIFGGGWLLGPSEVMVLANRAAVEVAKAGKIPKKPGR